jgi:hypothetical protein
VNLLADKIEDWDMTVAGKFSVFNMRCSQYLGGNQLVQSEVFPWPSMSSSPLE